MPKRRLTVKKAKKILRHGSVRGKPLTAKAKRFMGARAGGKPVKPKEG
jgi:hypothetical protein